MGLPLDTTAGENYPRTTRPDPQPPPPYYRGKDPTFWVLLHVVGSMVVWAVVTRAF